MQTRYKVSQKQTPGERIISKRMKEQGSKKGKKNGVVPRERDIARLEGQRGVDSRVQHASTRTALDQLVVKQQDSSIDVRISRGSRVVEHLAMGIVLAALKKGWTNNLLIDEQAFVYASYVYLTQSFYSAMQGTVPKLQSAPLWFWHITQALLPTTQPFKTAFVTYKWDLEDGIQEQVPPPVEVLAPVTVSFGLPDTTLPKVNGLYQLATPVYTVDLGEAAIKSLFEVWTSEGLTAMSSYFESPLKDDTSAFSALYPELGSSPGSEGAMATTTYSERYITSPLLAKFGVYQNDQFRGWSYVGRSAGAACYVLTKMAEMKTVKQIYNKIPPMFKFYDFNEFFEVLSLTLGFALERQQSSNVGTPIGPCPLTAQSVAILLRQAMMPAFNNEMAQDVYQTGNNTFNYFPFSAGVNGVSLTSLAQPILLPMFLAETIRAASRKRIRLGGGELDLIPVLASREIDNAIGNYFANGALLYAEDPAEIPVNLTNMSYDDVGTQRYLSPNGTSIANQTETWNQWIKGLGSFLTPLTTPAQATGPAILSTVTMTRQTRYIEPQNEAIAANRRAPARQASKKDLGLIVKSTLRLGTVNPTPVIDYFERYGVMSVTSTNTPLLPSWKYQRVMILPIWTSERNNSGGATPYRQVFQIEPFKISTSGLSEDINFVELPTLLTMHKNAALLDVRTELSPASEIVQDFETLNARGDGGFFTAVAGIFAEDLLGIKGAKHAASAIGALTGL